MAEHQLGTCEVCDLGLDHDPQPAAFICADCDRTECVCPPGAPTPQSEPLHRTVTAYTRRPTMSQLQDPDKMRTAMHTAGLRAENDPRPAAGATALASYVGVSKQMIHQLLTGARSNVTPQTAERIEFVLRCPGLFVPVKGRRRGR